jgi:hypothetical protein
LVSNPFRAKPGGSGNAAEDLFAKAILRRRSIPNLMGRKHAQPVCEPVSSVLAISVPHLQDPLERELHAGALALV